MISLGVAVALALAPTLSHAAPPAADAAEAQGEDPSPEADPVMSEAKRLFDAGVARYTAADYEAAVDLWLEAYAMVPPAFENRLIKAELIYNVARAQQKWFEIDRDVKHLRQSREILDRYLGEIDELYGDQAPLEREKIQEQIDEVDEQIGEWEAEQARREAELAERMRPTFDEEADAREEKRNKAMIGAGAGLTALGVGGVGMLVTGIVFAGAAQDSSGGLPLEADIPAREAAITRGEAGNALMVIGSLAAGVFLAAGVPLLAVGGSAEKKRKQRRADAGLDQARVDAIAPLWVRGGAGLAIGGRF
ncbi:hypothetical protein ENSA5_51980 [Enhygromyxa salina]|uniref:Tetratricopeptide repeat protein n=2 Tax=Enhygromyxa salina TaxID=215803 RepID=A0A2S9XGM9_9BACT|nr:hypothetical protein ENSA5_51980 [Enhygromyxa salina]